MFFKRFFQKIHQKLDLDSHLKIQHSLVTNSGSVFNFENSKCINDGRNKFVNSEQTSYTAESVAWTKDEIKLVYGILERLNDSVPGLMILATAGGPISLVRAKSITYNNGGTADAIAGQGRLVLSNQFFLANDKCHVLAHELTHLADNGYFVAYSKEWINIAEPIILEYRKRQAEIGTPANSLQDVWPSDYGCVNLIEALSEYVAAYANKKYFISRSEFEQTVAPSIIAPTKDLIRWKALVFQAQHALSIRNTSYATSNFEQAAELFPDHFFPYHFLAGISATSGELTKTIFYTEKMLAAFHIAGSSLNIEQKYVDILVSAFANSRKTRESASFTAWLSETYPKSKIL